MSGGSQQLRRFRIAVRGGEPIERAAALAGIRIGEARLIVAEDARTPPPADAYRPLAATFCARCAADLCGCDDLDWQGIAA